MKVKLDTSSFGARDIKVELETKRDAQSKELGAHWKELTTLNN